MDQLDVQPIQPANAVRDAALRNQLLTRRERLHSAITTVPNAEGVRELLREVRHRLGENAGWHLRHLRNLPRSH
jgi:hypothetical protein